MVCHPPSEEKFLQCSILSEKYILASTSIFIIGVPVQINQTTNSFHMVATPNTIIFSIMKAIHNYDHFMKLSMYNCRAIFPKCLTLFNNEEDSARMRKQGILAGSLDSY